MLKQLSMVFAALSFSGVVMGGVDCSSQPWAFLSTVGPVAEDITTVTTSTWICTDGAGLHQCVATAVVTQGTSDVQQSIKLDGSQTYLNTDGSGLPTINTNVCQGSYRKTYANNLCSQNPQKWTARTNDNGFSCSDAIDGYNCMDGIMYCGSGGSITMQSSPTQSYCASTLTTNTCQQQQPSYNSSFPVSGSGNGF